jgi:hypothetical protein
MSCETVTLSLGAYVVGSLDSAERLDVETHLHTCPACREVLAEFAGLPGLMGKLALDDVISEPVPATDELFDRLATRARAESRRNRHRRLAAVAAAVVLLVGGGLGAWAGVDHSHSSGRPPAFSATSDGVRMDVDLAGQQTGTGLTVTVSGLHEQEHCRLYAFSTDGRRELAGSWTSTYSGWARETGSTTIPRSQLASLELVDAHGHQLVTVDI